MFHIFALVLRTIARQFPSFVYLFCFWSRNILHILDRKLCIGDLIFAAQRHHHDRSDTYPVCVSGHLMCFSSTSCKQDNVEGPGFTSNSRASARACYWMRTALSKMRGLNSALSSHNLPAVRRGILSLDPSHK